MCVLIWFYVCIYIYIYMHMVVVPLVRPCQSHPIALSQPLPACELGRDCCTRDCGGLRSLREMGGAPRNRSHRNHLLVWIVEPSGCHCTDRHLASRAFTEDSQISQSADPTLGALPLPPTTQLRPILWKRVDFPGHWISIYVYIYIYIYIDICEHCRQRALRALLWKEGILLARDIYLCMY